MDTEWVKRKLEEEMGKAKTANDKAVKVIWAAIVINMGLGAVPFGINIWTFIGVVTVLITVLGGIYNYHVSNEDAATLIKYIFTSVGATFFAFTMGLKFFAEVLKGAGIITIGGATAAGMALDAVLSGVVTYAMGFTTKEYFMNGKQMSPGQINARFRHYFQEGRTQVNKHRE